MALERRVYGRRERLSPWARRRRARQGHRGRRGARDVPLETQWEVHVFRPPNMSDKIVLRLVEDRAAIVAVAWRRIRLADVPGRMRRRIDRRGRRAART